MFVACIDLDDDGVATLEVSDGSNSWEVRVVSAGTPDVAFVEDQHFTPPIPVAVMREAGAFALELRPPGKPVENDLPAVLGVWWLVPEWRSIPKRFRAGRTCWSKLADIWFFHGLKGPRFYPRGGVEERHAHRHLAAVMHSYTISHEHKIAGVAYLMSRWFERVEHGGKVYE